MTPFWNGFFAHLKSCGRNGGIFQVAIFVFFAAAISLVILQNEGVVLNPVPFLAVIGAAAVIWVCVVVRRMRIGRTRSRFPRLSDDELRVARERLKSSNRRNTSRPPAGQGAR